MSLRSLCAISLGTALCAALSARVAGAQQGGPWDYRAPTASRQQLGEVLARYQAAAQSPAYSQALRASAAAVADSIRARLSNGDLHAGDRIKLTVSEQLQLSDSFTVSDGPALVLPVVGSIALAGVLRSELQDRIAASVDSVYRNAVVRVVLLTRLAIIGGVGRPGFFALPGDALVDDAITYAGGLTATADLKGTYIERGGVKLWTPDSLQVAMRERRTIADLGLRAGDRIIVPTVLPKDPARTVQTISYLVSVPLSIYALLKLF